MSVIGRSSFPSRREGFSLIEVILALALVASAIVTFMALVPVGLRSSQDATDSIVMGHILEDAHERLEGEKLKDGSLETGPFYYDSEGVFVVPVDSEVVSPGGGNDDTEEARTEKRDGRERRVYRVDIELVRPFDPQIRSRAPDLKAVILDVSWPVDPESGEVAGEGQRTNRKSVSYYVNALTGPSWSEADGDFEPVIEF